MNRLFAFLLFAFAAASTFAQAPHIPPNATVYIEPMDGYETYLAAAIAKKQVPQILVVRGQEQGRLRQPTARSEARNVCLAGCRDQQREWER